jgi:hypothetical protein
LIGEDTLEAFAPPGLAVTVYELIGFPPSEAGGLKVTTAVWLPDAAVTPVGAPGRPGVSAMVILVLALVIVALTGAERFSVKYPGSATLQSSRSTRTTFVVTPGEKFSVPLTPT